MSTKRLMEHFLTAVFAFRTQRPTIQDTICIHNFVQHTLLKHHLLLLDHLLFFSVKKKAKKLSESLLCSQNYGIEIIP